jgi:hypothetical protein
MVDLAAALADAGGPHAPLERCAQLRGLLERELAHGAGELGLARSGRGRPVLVAFAAAPDGLLAATPAPAVLRADAEAAPERAWLLVAATVAALVDVVAPPPPATSDDLALRAGDLGGRLVLHAPARPGASVTPADAELAALAFEERAAGIDRLRSAAVALPAHVLAGAERELRPPIGASHPLRVAEAVARLGADPVDPTAAEVVEEQVLALLGAGDGAGAVRPHDDPDPARRVARRILQRLDGMGKWGGYHTEFAHLARGFAGNDRALAEEVGEALLAAGLLEEKPSVGQRHVFLNPRRAGDIHRLIAGGENPADLALP